MFFTDFNNFLSVISRFYDFVKKAREIFLRFGLLMFLVASVMGVEYTWDSDINEVSREHDSEDIKIQVTNNITVTTFKTGTAQNKYTCIYLNGNSLTITDLYVGYSDDGGSKKLNGQLKIIGPGSITITNIYKGKSSNNSQTVDETDKNSIEISGGAIYSFPSNYTSVFTNGGNIHLEGGIDARKALVWNGTDSSNWFTASNWTNGTSVNFETLKTNFSDYSVIIPSGCTNYPNIDNNNVNIGTLSIASGATLSITNVARVTFAKPITNAGEIKHSSSKQITFSGTVNNSGSITTGGSGAVTFNDEVTNTGTITFGGSGAVTLTKLNKTDKGTVIFNYAGDITLTSPVDSTIFNDIEIKDGTRLTTSSDFSVGGNWTNEGSFTSSGDIRFLGEKEQSIDIKGTFNVTATVNFCYAGDKTTTITVDSGVTAKVGTFWMNYGNDGTNDSKVILTGSGTFVCETFDFPYYNHHTIIIEKDATLQIQTTLYGDALEKNDTDYRLFFEGNGTLYIPASGANVSWGKNRISYKKETLTIKPIGEPSIYTVTCENVANFSATSKIDIKLGYKTNGNYTVNFPYVITDSKNTNNYLNIENKAITDTANQDNEYFDNPNSNNTVTKSISMSSQVTTHGDGFTITFYAPDGSGLILASFAWYYQKPTWTGETNSSWTDMDNWIELPSGITPNDLSAYDITISTGKNDPVISSDVKVGSIKISGGKTLTLESGTLTVVGSSSYSGNIVISGDYEYSESSFLQTGGTVTGGAFTMTGNSIITLQNATLSSFNASEPGGGQPRYGSPQITVNSSATIKVGSFTLTDGELTINSDANLTSTGDIKIEKTCTVQGGTLQSTDGTMTFGSVSNVGNAAFTGGTAITLKGTSEIYGANVFSSISVNGYSHFYGANTFSSIIVNGNASFYDSNTFSSITVDNSSIEEKTSLKFASNTTQTINNSDSSAVWFKGYNADNRLVIDSTDSSSDWNVIFGTKPARSNFEYVTVKHSKSVHSSYAKNELNIHPSDENILDGGNNSYWFAPASFIWKGSASSSWFDVSNWLNGSDSTSVSVYPDYESGGDTITIDTDTSGNELDLAQGSLPSMIKIKALSVNADKELKIEGKYITAQSITVNGKISLHGNQTSSPFGTTTPAWGDNSSIEYYGAVDGSDVLCVSSSTTDGVTENTYNSLILNKNSGYKTTFNNGVVLNSFTDNANNKAVFYGNKFEVTGDSEITISGENEFNAPSAGFVFTASSGGITFNGTNTFRGNVKFDCDTTFTNNFTISDGGMFTHNGMLTFSGGSSQTVTNSGSLLFKNVTVSNSNGVTINGTASVTGNMTVNSGTSLTQNGDITLYGAFVNSGGTVAITGTTELKSTFNNTGTITLAGDVTASGSWNNSGTFTQSAGKATFTQSAPVINGDNTFYDLAFTNAGQSVSFEEGKTQTITNSLVITGEETNLITLKSSVDGSKWYISPTASTDINVSCVSVKDSYSNYDSITANNSSDQGNNTNWKFPNMLYTWTGSSDTSWVNALNWNPSSLPAEDSKVHIPGGVTNYPVLSNPITVLNLSVGSSGDSSASLSLSGNDLSVMGITDGAFSNYGTVYLHGTETVTLPEGDGSVVEEGIWSFIGGDSANGIVQNIANLDFNEVCVTGSAQLGTINAQKLTLGSDDGSEVSLSSVGDCTVTADITVKDGVKFDFDNLVKLIGEVTVESDFVNSGSLAVEGDVTASGAWTNTGVITLAGDLTAGDAWNNSGTFTQSSGRVTFTSSAPVIKGDNTFYDLAFTTAGQSVSFEEGKTQTVTNELVITGTEDNLICLCSTVDGSIWNISAVSTNVKYVNIKDSSVTAEQFAFKSVDGGNNTNWIFAGNSYTWVGGTTGKEKDWFTAGNWSPASVPGKYNTVTIASVDSGNYPVLTGSIDLGSGEFTHEEETYKGELTVDSGASFDFAGQSITAYAIYNNGAVRLKGDELITVTTPLSESLGSQASVEYCGGSVQSPVTTLLWGSHYDTLITSGVLNVSQGISVQTYFENTGNFTISGDILSYCDWNNSGSLKQTSGTAIFNFANPVISGDNEFYDFSYTYANGTLTFGGYNTFNSLVINGSGITVVFPVSQDENTDIKRQVINQKLNLLGTEDGLLILQKTRDDTSELHWFIDYEGEENADIEYVQVSYSYAINILTARLSKNEHNNINWRFSGLSFLMTLARQNKLFVLLDRFTSTSLSDYKSTMTFIDKDANEVSDLYIVSAEPKAEEEYTQIIYTLNRKVSFEDITNHYIMYKSSDTAFIRDDGANMMEDYACHPISDFALDVVVPVYAYDNRQTSMSAEEFALGAYEGSWAVHDWNRSQGAYGTLTFGTDVLITANLNTGDYGDINSSKIALYYDNSPDSDSCGNVLKELTGFDLRAWLPLTLSDGSSSSIFEPFAEVNNEQKGTIVDDDVSDGLKFTIDRDDIGSDEGFAKGDQISFLFGLEDMSICHTPKSLFSGKDFKGLDVSETSPLFALRLQDNNDFSSLDLWSFKLGEVKSQRGNVTILNNVINVNNNEKTNVKVNMSSTGFLNIIVMTLDGNIVKYLQHGTLQEGDHYFSWDGKTKSGKSCARGLYFVRVFGNGIDETRKVMVVKD